jgi:thiamine biosynthesis lipoprotein
MGMPITIEVVDTSNRKIFDKVFSYFEYIDNKFSTYKTTSEITLINQGQLPEKSWSQDMREVFELSEQTKKETDGFFDIKKDGQIDPSGLVKGWAIKNAADILKKEGFKNFYIEAGGDIQASGKNKEAQKWTVGIKNPFNHEQIVKVLSIKDEGVATSGTYIRGDHIYDPKNQKELKEVVSITVIGPDIYEADRFATAAFAMGREGIYLIEKLPGFEGYMIDYKGLAISTSSLKRYLR